MAEIAASMVMELRQRTGLGMMECKKALAEAAGDMTKAEELLRIKSGAKASKAADRIAALESWVQRGFAPDLTLLFDVPPDVAEARRSAARTADRFEREADSFFSRVRNAYLERARAEPARIRVLDARHSIADLSGMPLVTIDDTLKRLHNDGEIQRVARGRYAPAPPIRPFRAVRW